MSGVSELHVQKSNKTQPDLIELTFDANSLSSPLDMNRNVVKDTSEAVAIMVTIVVNLHRLT